MKQPIALTVSTRLYTVLLALYPVAYRKEYGADMMQVFQDVSRASYQRQGITGIVCWWCATLPDLLFTALEQHKEGTIVMSKSLPNRPIKGSGLGLMCLMGGLIYTMGGLWLSLVGVPTDPFGIQLTNLLKMMWAGGTTCGLMGLTVLGAINDTPVSRIAAWVSGLGLVAITVDGLIALVIRNPISPFSGSALPFSPIAQVVVLIGWCALTLAILNANRWTGWTRFAPVVMLVAPFIGLLVGSLLGMTFFPVIIMGLALMLFGFAIQTHLDNRRQTTNALSPAL